jgi:hypothetical protein
MSSRKSGRLKHKNHAQDCETLTRDQHPAILPWFLYFGWRPSFRKSRAPCPLCPAAGLLLDVLFEHDLAGKTVSVFSHHTLAHDCLSKVAKIREIGKSGFRKIMRKRAPEARVN